MFALSVRYHLWRAGGAAKVRAEFNQWVAARSSSEFLFVNMPNGAPVPVTALPPAVRYMNDHFPSRFGVPWHGIAEVDNVVVLTTTNIMIGPPGWEPEGGVSIWDRLWGSRRKLADGIWLQVGSYSK